MNLNHNRQQLLSLLHTFNVAARHLSFTHAAQELFLTQGGVSNALKSLKRCLTLTCSLGKRGNSNLPQKDSGFSVF